MERSLDCVLGASNHVDGDADNSVKTGIYNLGARLEQVTNGAVNSRKYLGTALAVVLTSVLARSLARVLASVLAVVLGHVSNKK